MGQKWEKVGDNPTFFLELGQIGRKVGAERPKKTEGHLIVYPSAPVGPWIGA
jgi:hypothetical protein